MPCVLKENEGIPKILLIIMALATGFSVANCYYNQSLLGSCRCLWIRPSRRWGLQRTRLQNCHRARWL